MVACVNKHIGKAYLISNISSTESDNSSNVPSTESGVTTYIGKAYLGSNMSSTESDVNKHIGKANLISNISTESDDNIGKGETAINNSSTIELISLKQKFFKPVTISVLPYGYTTWTKKMLREKARWVLHKDSAHHFQ